MKFYVRCFLFFGKPSFKVKIIFRIHSYLTRATEFFLFSPRRTNSITRRYCFANGPGPVPLPGERHEFPFSWETRLCLKILVDVACYFRWPFSHLGPSEGHFLSFTLGCCLIHFPSQKYHAAFKQNSFSSNKFILLYIFFPEKT